MEGVASGLRGCFFPHIFYSVQEPLPVTELLIKVGLSQLWCKRWVSVLRPSLRAARSAGAFEEGNDTIAGAWKELLWVDQLDIGFIGGAACGDAWVLV